MNDLKSDFEKIDLYQSEYDKEHKKVVTAIQERFLAVCDFRDCEMLIEFLTTVNNLIVSLSNAQKTILETSRTLSDTEVIKVAETASLKAFTTAKELRDIYDNTLEHRILNKSDSARLKAEADKIIEGWMTKAKSLKR